MRAAVLGLSMSPVSSWNWLFSPNIIRLSESVPKS